MNFNKRKNLLDGLLDYLCKLADEAPVEEVKEEVKEEEVKEDDKYEMVEGGFVFVKEDGTVYFEDPEKTVESGEIELVDNKIMVIEDRKLVEVKDKEVVEEELPTEAPVELVDKTPEIEETPAVEDGTEEESVEITIDDKVFNVSNEVAEAIKGLIDLKEKEKGELKCEIQELQDKVQKLESMVPSVSPVGIEISNKEGGKAEKKAYTLRDFVNS